jgi:hypothetical protein
MKGLSTVQNISHSKISAKYIRFMGRACSTKGEKRNTYRIMMGKPERKRPLRRPRRRWVDNIKMDLKVIG